eukprot:3438844-Rhodomonas_salina.2
MSVPSDTSIPLATAHTCAFFEGNPFPRPPLPAMGDPRPAAMGDPRPAATGAPRPACPRGEFCAAAVPLGVVFPCEPLGVVLPC